MKHYGLGIEKIPLKVIMDTDVVNLAETKLKRATKRKRNIMGRKIRYLFMFRILLGVPITKDPIRSDNQIGYDK